MEPIRRIYYTDGMNQAAPRSARPPSGRSVRGVFVGRQRELAELKSVLEDALAGQGRLVILVAAMAKKTKNRITSPRAPQRQDGWIRQPAVEGGTWDHT